jgi:hypothetical protein
MELALERIGYSYGWPVVVATHVGETFDRPIRAAVSRFASGQLRFEYAGRPYDAAMMPADLNPSSLTSCPDGLRPRADRAQLLRATVEASSSAGAGP